MAYVVGLVVLAALVGLHELVFRTGVRRFRRGGTAVAAAGAASYVAIAALAFTLFAIRGVDTYKRIYVVDQVLDRFDAAGKLEPEDRIVAFGGEELVAGRGPMLAERVAAAGGAPVQLTIVRAGRRRDVTIQPTHDARGNWLLGIRQREELELDRDVGRAAAAAVRFPVSSLVDALTPAAENAPSEGVGGPVRIVQEFRNAFVPVWVVVAHQVLLAAVAAMIAQVIVDLFRLYRRKGA